MGCYLNVDGKTKESWLKENALPVTPLKAADHDNYDDMLLVCLVQNHAFSAAAIAYDRKERDYFLDPNDLRPKSFFLVERAKLPGEVAALLNRYQKVQGGAA